MSAPATEAVRTYRSNVGVPESNRQALIALLNARLADSVDLYSQIKWAHWNVKGSDFIQLHEWGSEWHGSGSGRQERTEGSGSERQRWPGAIEVAGPQYRAPRQRLAFGSERGWRPGRRHHRGPVHNVDAGVRQRPVVPRSPFAGLIRSGMLLTHSCSQDTPAAASTLVFCLSL